MTGSRRWGQYRSDRNITWALELDETVLEIPEFGFEQLGGGAAAPQNVGRILQVSSTRPIKVRRANAVAIDANQDTVRRSFVVGSITSDIWTGVATSFTVDGLNFSVTSLVGECVPVVPRLDTGITDGDVDENSGAPT